MSYSTAEIIQPGQSEEADKSDTLPNRIKEECEVIDLTLEDDEKLDEDEMLNSSAPAPETAATRSRIVKDTNSIRLPVNILEKYEITLHRGHTIKYRKREKHLMCIECNIQVCPVCYKNFHKSLKNHFRSGKKVLCESCDIFIPSQCAMKAHKKLHKQSTLGSFACPDCGLYFNSLGAFINHNLTSCFHFFRRSEFFCSLCCHVSFMSLCLFDRHIQNHIVCHFQCRDCFHISFYSRSEAVEHLERDHNLKEKDLLKLFHFTLYCEFCQNNVSLQHWIEHRDAKPRMILQCSCNAKINCESSFSSHRGYCRKSLTMPTFWEHVMFKTHSRLERDLVKSLKLCKICNIFFQHEDLGLICPKCLENMDVSFSESSLGAFGSSVSVGAEEQVGLDKEMVEMCDIIYPQLSPDHNYCIIQDFLSLALKQKKNQDKEFFKVFVDINEEEPARDQRITLPLKPASAENLRKHSNQNQVKCNVCSMVLSKQNGKKPSFNSLVCHFQTFHGNIVLCDPDVRLPPPIKKTEPQKPVVNVRMKENVAKREKNQVVEATNAAPPEEKHYKEHEFWDEYYEVLVTANNRTIPREDKFKLLTKMKPSKRKVKKPKRLVEELLTEREATPKKKRLSAESSVSPGKSRKSNSEKKPPGRKKLFGENSIEEDELVVHLLDEKNYPDCDLKEINNETPNLSPEIHCSVCNEVFYNATDLKQHFRKHGLAFLQKK